MEIIFENKKTRAVESVKVNNIALFEEPEDLVVRIGYDYYNLTSTKSKEEKEKEQMMIEFGEKCYPEMYAKYEEMTELPENEIKEYIASELDKKYKSLKEKFDQNILIMSLYAGFANFFQYQKKRLAILKEIEDTKKHDNIIYDYYYRLKEIAESATSIKDFTELLNKWQEFIDFDNRSLRDRESLLKCVLPFFKWLSELNNEFKQMKPYIPLKEQAIYDDKEYFTENYEPYKKEILKNIEERIGYYEKLADQLNNIDESLFNYCIKYCQTNYESFLKVFDEYHKVLSDLNQLDATRFHTANENIHKEISRFFVSFKELEDSLYVSAKKFASGSEYDIIYAHLDFVRDFMDAMKTATSQSMGEIIGKFAEALHSHVIVLKKIYEGILDPVKLTNQEYTEKELFQ